MGSWYCSRNTPGKALHGTPTSPTIAIVSSNQWDHNEEVHLPHIVQYILQFLQLNPLPPSFALGNPGHVHLFGIHGLLLQWEAGQETCLLSRDDANLKGVADVDARPGDHPTSSPWLPHHLQAIASFMGAMLKASPIMVVGYGRVSWSTPWNHPLVQGRPRHNSTSSNLRSWMMIITYQSLTNQYHPIAHSSQPNGLFQQGNSQKECRPFNWCLIILSSKRKAANIVQPL